MKNVWIGLLLLTVPSWAEPKVEEPFDRLDGAGASQARVDVIEWYGNLEIHVYPKGRLSGLAFKLDKKNKEKPVMVLGYRFQNDPKKQVIRRAIIGVPFLESPLFVYEDLETDGTYTKLILTNHNLDKTKGLKTFKADAPPKQLYPEGHPELTIIAEDGRDREESRRFIAETRGEYPNAKTPEPSSFDGDSGAIQHYSF